MHTEEFRDIVDEKLWKRLDFIAYCYADNYDEHHYDTALRETEKQGKKLEKQGGKMETKPFTKWI